MNWDYQTGITTYEKYDLAYIAVADKLIGPNIEIKRCVILSSGSCHSRDEETTIIKIQIEGENEVNEVPVASVSADPDNIRQHIIDSLS